MNKNTHALAFIDILGFKYLMRNPEAIKTVISIIEKELKNTRSGLTGRKAKYFKSTIFSDSIIISSKLTGNLENIRSTYKLLCQVVAEIQIKLICKGVWVRGGISHGTLQFSKNENDTIIYGEALVKAYNIETNSAIFPRVIIDSDIIEFLGFKNKKSFINYFNDYDGSFIRENVFNNRDILSQEIERKYLDIDTPIFIDYLDFIFNKNKKSNPTIKKKLFLDYLEEYLNNNNPEIFRKYNWVRLYALQKIESIIGLSEGITPEKMDSLNKSFNRLIEM